MFNRLVTEKYSAIQKIITSVSLAGTISLVACGGGGADTPTNQAQPKPEGAYRGTLSGGNSFSAIILDNNQAYALVGVTDAMGVLRVSSFLDIPGNVTGNTFVSGSAREFLFDGQQSSGSVNATFIPRTNFSGSTVFAGRSGSFSGAGIPVSEFNYDVPAANTQVVGNWSGGLLSGEGFSIAITAAGTVSGSSQFGCQFTGSIIPRPGGKAVFDAALNFGSAPCLTPGQTARGVALVTRLNDGRSQLLIAGTNAARTLGTVGFATR